MAFAAREDHPPSQRPTWSSGRPERLCSPACPHPDGLTQGAVGTPSVGRWRAGRPSTGTTRGAKRGPDPWPEPAASASGSRLLAAFVGGALLLSAAVAVLSYGLTRRYLLTQRETSAQRQAEVNARLVGGALRSASGLPQLLGSLQTPAGSSTVVRHDGRWYAASLDLGREAIPAGLQEAVLEQRSRARQRYRPRPRPPSGCGAAAPRGRRLLRGLSAPGAGPDVADPPGGPDHGGGGGHGRRRRARGLGQPPAARPAGRHRRHRHLDRRRPARRPPRRRQRGRAGRPGGAASTRWWTVSSNASSATPASPPT